MVRIDDHTEVMIVPEGLLFLRTVIMPNYDPSAHVVRESSVSTHMLHVRCSALSAEEFVKKAEAEQQMHESAKQNSGDRGS